MADVSLSDDEARLVRLALSQLVVKSGPGELGIMHGANRFVSTGVPVRAPDQKVLDAAARKLGLSAGVRRFEL